MSHPTNRLNRESSPYLLQHAQNPVAWQPWDETALQLARQLDRPIFLSIGYSACHWCHVMEHESFENPAIAQWMNEHFINIKVDREERPDLDQIYMTAVTTMTGSGGWPMSVFLTPELKPFYGGTYWPPESRYGRPGFSDVLRGVHDAWVNRREAVEGQAKELTAAIQSASAPSKNDATLGENLLQNAMERLVSSADREWGGFGRAPKFPHPMDLRLLLRLAQRFSSPLALNVVTLTLDKMATGGIYDHLGGGFARYSTDERWLVPHFEKMLYDNAQLVPVYLEAWQITGSPLYLQVVRETLDYILREMTSPEGPFYSTQDADSEGVEGKFFVWTLDEIQRHLDPLEALTFAYAYDVSAHGNWEHVNILNCPRSREEVARHLNMELPAVEQLLASSRQKLFAIRAERIWPGRDEKMLAGWNGLMIAAMAQAGAALQEPTYIQAAARAANFLTQNLLDAEGKLCHSFQGGVPRFNGYLDDYAAMIDGLLELAQATGESGYIENAMRLATRLRSHFAAPEGGYYYTSHDHEPLIVRQRDQHDNATPSGNSLAAYALVKLARMTGVAAWEDEAHKTLQAMSTVLERLPMAAGQALLALDWLLGPSRELVFCEGEDKKVNQRVLQHLGHQFLPRTLQFVKRALLSGADVKLPCLVGKTSQHGEATLYVCSGETCQAPLIGEPTILAAKY